MKNNSLDLQNLVQGFKLSCQTKGKSPKTIDWYTTFLDRFIKFLEYSDFPTYVKQIETNHIRKFIRYLQVDARTPHTSKPLSPATVQGYVRTLKAFFSWVTKEDYVKSNPMTRIPVPRATSKIVNTFIDEQVSSLAMLCRNSNGY